MTVPSVASSSRIRSFMSVDLPAPDGPTRKTKSPSGMTRSTSWRALRPFGYVFVTLFSTRAGRPPEPTSCSRSDGADARRGPRRRSVRVSVVKIGSADRASPDRRSGGGAGLLPRARRWEPRVAPRLHLRRRTGQPRSRRTLEQPGRDRGVAREVAERGRPAQDRREALDPEARLERRPDRLVRCARQPGRRRAAGLDRNEEMGEDRRKELRIADRDRPDAPGIGGVAVAEERPGIVNVGEGVAAVAAVGRIIDPGDVAQDPPVHDRPTPPD